MVITTKYIIILQLLEGTPLFIPSLLSSLCGSAFLEISQSYLIKHNLTSVHTLRLENPKMVCNYTGMGLHCHYKLSWCVQICLQNFTGIRFVTKQGEL